MTGDQNESNFLDDELEDRLDELFGNENAQAQQVQTASPSDGPLDDLKSSVLSIDWEITDEGLQNFASKIKSARKSFSEDKIVTMFLQILGSLGEYIKSNRGNAHPKTFKILTSVFSGLEKVVTGADLTEIEKKKTLQVELKRYNELRGLIQKNKTKTKKASATPVPSDAQQMETSPSPQPQGPVVREPATDDAISLQSLMAAIEDLKGFVQTEFEALRKELMR
ncbi:MAG: hypothetical protein KJO34_13000 [Deltaproteobacteria bacterium]|nr:hypothetical protein [Deltaproteobacteria bacterium]